VCVFKNDWRVPHMLASRSRPRCSDGACDVRCASPPPSQWWGACAKTARGGATTWVFSLPPSFSSLLLENCVAIVKNQKNLSVCLLSQIRFSFYWLQYIWPWIIYWVNLFFLFHHFTLNFYIRFGPYFFNCNVFGLKSFIKFFFKFIPLHLILY